MYSIINVRVSLKCSCEKHLGYIDIFYRIPHIVLCNIITPRRMEGALNVVAADSLSLRYIESSNSETESPKDSKLAEIFP